jgi:hypothetical protein
VGLQPGSEFLANRGYAVLQVIPWLDGIRAQVLGKRTSGERQGTADGGFTCFHTDKVKVPLLIAQGTNDPQGKQGGIGSDGSGAQGRGIEVAYIVKNNEGHGFSNEENRFEFYRAMEECLSKHLGGRVERRSE